MTHKFDMMSPDSHLVMVLESLQAHRYWLYKLAGMYDTWSMRFGLLSKELYISGLHNYGIMLHVTLYSGKSNQLVRLQQEGGYHTYNMVVRCKDDKCNKNHGSYVKVSTMLLVDFLQEPANRYLPEKVDTRRSYFECNGSIAVIDNKDIPLRFGEGHAIRIFDGELELVI